MTKIVVICYPNDWHWVLSLEYINTQLVDKTRVEVWDYSWVGENGIRNWVKRFLGGSSLQRKCKKWLRNNNIEIRRQKLWLSPRPSIKKQFKSIALKSEYLNYKDHHTIFNTVVEKVGNLSVKIKNHQRVIKKELRTTDLVARNIDLNQSPRVDAVITVNGRFSKNVAVKKWFEQAGCGVKLIEFGADEERYEEFHVSPHSVTEITRKMTEYWQSADDNIRDEVSKSYLDALLNDKVSKIPWREKIENSEIPKFAPDKKICVFFASTESEMAGLGDQIIVGNYRNQVEAFSSLVETLPGEEWQIFLRRHPANPYSSKETDPEQHLWQEFENRSNVSIIEPNSCVDSIALGMKADITANYWSTIAVELMIRGHRRVITMGDAPWNSMLPEYWVPNVLQLQRFLHLDPPKIKTDRIFPWAYYYAVYGKKFEVFEFNSALKRWIFKNNSLI